MTLNLFCQMTAIRAFFSDAWNAYQFDIEREAVEAGKKDGA